MTTTEALPTIYTLTDEAPKNKDYGSKRHYGILNEKGKFVVLPGVICFAMTIDEALDALLELRGIREADTLR